MSKRKALHNLKPEIQGMFTRKATILKKTGPDGTGRYEFLKQLIVEFGTSTSIEAKRQVLANLANFAYDPVNFEYLKQLHAIDLFLDQLSGNNEEFLHFGLSALCNISPDPESKDYIIKLNGIKLISDNLLHDNEEIALNAITTLYFLVVPASKHLISPEIREKIKVYSTHNNQRYKNLVGDKATISKIITKEDLEKFTELSGDSNPIHSTHGQERAIVHGALLNSLVSGIIGTKLPGPGCMVIGQNLNFPNKCYVGETVKISVELVEKRKILTVKFTCAVSDKDNKIVLFGDAKLILKK